MCWRTDWSERASVSCPACGQFRHLAQEFLLFDGPQPARPHHSEPLQCTSVARGTSTVAKCLADRGKLTPSGVRQGLAKDKEVQVFHGVRPSQLPRPRVMQGLAARLNLKRSQGIPRAGY